MSAKSTGADTKGSSNPSNRQHNQGNQDRKYTVEQKAAVLRVRKCSATAFYEILGLEATRSTCTESDIKKAYRKLSLLTHPDKNGHEHADEAFKMVSRAFGVLGDEGKRAQYDRTGGDPDSRSGGGAPATNPFAGRGGGGGGFGGGFQGEMTPEEMFNRFFGGGGMGGGGFGPFGGGLFDTGPQFVFNMGGGPGVRVHQFGGARPQRRPADPNAPQQPQNLWTTLLGLLPLLVLFVIPLLNSLFSAAGGSSGPQFRFDHAAPPATLHRLTPTHKIDYWINPADVRDYTERKLTQLDKKAEGVYVQNMRVECEGEMHYRQREFDAAQGIFFPDRARAKRAQEMEMPACNRLRSMGYFR